ncbi:MAG: exodeoxyribonuclease VII small subunit [Clostridium sp.]|nr:exodeoxyribonuclease VII small subunit [Clostridium sp.]
MKTEKEKKELEELSIEEIFGRLDGIIEKLEDGSVSLEDSFAYYENGMKLVKACSEKIDRVEKRILVLNGQEMEEQ